jgi:hypothetical protein
MANFKSLGAALFKKDLDRQHGIDPSPAAREWIDRIAAKSLACKP